LLGRIRVS